MDVKRILVPTDFSNYAAYAGDLAYKIAQKTGATLRFYHQLHFLVNFSEINEKAQAQSQREFITEKDVTKKFKAIKKTYGDDGDDVAIKTSFGYGNLIAEITDNIEKDEIDLVVMGTHGRSEKSSFLLGSNTLKVLRLAACPVLVVKSDQKDFAMNNIVFASDFSDDALPVFKQMLKFVKPFNATVHLFNIDVNRQYQNAQNIFQASIAKFKELAGENLGIVYSYPNKKIEEGLNRISKEYNIDLIAIGTHHREFDNIMYNSFITEAIVNKVDVPVLALHFEEEDEEFSVYDSNYRNSRFR